MWRIILVLSIALWGPLAACGDEESTSDAKRKALDEAIAKIEAAATPEDAASAYTAGRAIEARDAKLLDAYMRRMLKFGLPQVAQYAATTLAQIDDTNGLAWGVMGYIYGKNGSFPQALAACLKAIQYDADNAGVLHNLGILTAWHEHDPIGKTSVSSTLSEQVARGKSDWSSHGAFSEGAKQVSEALQKMEALRREWDQKIQAVEKEAEPLKREVDRYKKDLRRLEEEHKARQNDVNRWKRELNAVENDIDERKKEGKNTGNLRNRADRLRHDIRDYENKMRQLNEQGKGIYAKAKVVYDDFEEKQREAERMKRDAEREIRDARTYYDWQPPAVDGTVVPERPDFQMKAPVLTTPPPPAAIDPEEAAEKKLKLARLYIANNMREKAKPFLRDVIDLYPETDAAETARKLLRQLGEEY
jgi:tetratricopeptide (TPR) repeat protein